jgi:hypothetical protein
VSAPTTVTGRELYALLPTVYRVKDGNGDLARYLDACGTLLDRMRATLEQRLADAFPAPVAGTMAAQSWLLPYFADLFDVQLVSPHVKGRRAEVDRAIAWRQRKGTLATIEEIAEEVGGAEVEVQEGWRRVAVTPRPDRPLLPAAAFGVTPEPDPRNPLVARRHPALPVVTVDVTLQSRAIECDRSRGGSSIRRVLHASPAALTTPRAARPTRARQGRHAATSIRAGCCSSCRRRPVSSRSTRSRCRGVSGSRRSPIPGGSRAFSRTRRRTAPSSSPRSRQR